MIDWKKKEPKQDVMIPESEVAPSFDQITRSKEPEGYKPDKPPELKRPLTYPIPPAPPESESNICEICGKGKEDIEHSSNPPRRNYHEFKPRK